MSDITEIPGQPTGPYILVKVATLEKKSDGGIVLPDSVKRRETFDQTRGTVLKVGRDCYNDVFKRNVGCEKPWCKVGDEILFRSHASTFQGDPKDGLVIINDQDVIWNYSE